MARQIKEFREEHWNKLAGNRPPLPQRETIKNWLTKNIKAVSPKYAYLIDRFLNEEAYDVLTIGLEEKDRIAEVQRFFGTEANVIERMGPAIDGDWLMYRRWREPGGRYIVSPVKFMYSKDHRVITSTDTVDLRQAGAHFNDQTQLWEGIAVPQGKFVHMVHRTFDARSAHLTNLKFGVLDDLSFSDETDRHGQAKLHIMSGFGMIGMNTHRSGNSFVIVLERIKEPRDFPINPIPLEEIPQHVQDKIVDRENKFMKTYSFP